MTKTFDCVFALRKVWIQIFQHYAKRVLPLTPLLQVFIALRFYRTIRAGYWRFIGVSATVFAACTEPFTRFQVLSHPRRPRGR